MSLTYTVLANFDPSNYQSPDTVLIADANGDLFGSTTYYNYNDFDYHSGVVFEIVKTTSGYDSTPTVLGGSESFADSGYGSPSGLLADANGDLFGTTETGGAYVDIYGSDYTTDGTVFEIVKTAGGYASTPTVLASFNGSDGLFPSSGLISDADGNLFGTTGNGGADYGSSGPGSNGYGTVFEIAKTVSGYAATPTVLASFNGSDGLGPSSGLITDANGDLFGTTQLGGANGDGTVFEIVKTGNSYASTPTVLVSFNGTDGGDPYGGLIADATGDLFGTTEDGDGTVFEIVKTGNSYASTPTVLVSFNQNDGVSPTGGLIADANGNLFGETSGGGAHLLGDVFEIAKTTTGYASTPTVLFSFDQAVSGGLIADATGDLFGTAGYAVFEISDSGFVACYAEGTRIATPHGPRAVETLAAGDTVLTAGGATRPVAWTGSRRVDCMRHSDPRRVLPVRIEAHAFGPGMPGRPLFLSPDHAVFFAGVLIPIKYLVNRTTVAQVQVAAVTYYHVELPTHDILLAEGLPAESYLDTGDRDSFAAGDVVALNPGWGARRVTDAWESHGAAPLCIAGPVVERVCQALAAQSMSVGRRPVSNSQ